MIIIRISASRKRDLHHLLPFDSRPAEGFPVLFQFFECGFIVPGLTVISGVLSV